MNAEEATFEGWAILELMGHRRLAGYVQEVELAGHGMLRLDVPAGFDPDTGYTEDAPDDVQATQFYSPASLYCLTPTTAALARALAANHRPQPVQRWELPQPRPVPDLEEPAEAELLHDREEPIF